MRKRMAVRWLDEYLFSPFAGEEKKMKRIALFRLIFLAGMLLLVFLTARR